MTDKKVAIVLSTYNGEKYIEKQLESLVNQTYKNIDIYIRDDGSKDKTTEIIEKYESKYNNIKLIKANNVGLVNSFYEGLKSAFETGDYFAYCDQDDYWHQDKIERAIEKLEYSNNNTPTVLFTEFNYCDANLEFVEKSNMNKKGTSFKNSLVECIASGNTMVFNKKMAKLILETNTQNVCLHDWWLYMIATGIGNIIYDPEPSLEYRRTGNNVTPGGRGFLKLQIFRIKKFLFGDYLKKVKKQIQKYDENFHNELSEENQKLINLFIKDGYHINIVLKKVYYPKMFRQNLLDELLIRFIFLIGKL